MNMQMEKFLKNDWDYDGSTTYAVVKLSADEFVVQVESQPLFNSDLEISLEEVLKIFESLELMAYRQMYTKVGEIVNKAHEVEQKLKELDIKHEN